MNARLVASGVLVLAVLGSPLAAVTPPVPREAADEESLGKLVAGANAFAVDLYARLAGQEGNLFFSPGSVHTALAMTYAGARGKTAGQMAQTLHLELSDEKLHAAAGALLAQLNNPQKDPEGKPAYQLTVANALWGRKGYSFEPDFLALLKKHYGADLSELDFAQSEPARKTINDWVARQTKDKIQDLIGPGVLNDMTRLVLTNAVYFKSGWMHKFAKEATSDEPFHLSAEKSVSAPTMHLESRLGYLEDDELQALELPYAQGALSMIVLLPKKTDGLGALEKGLSAEKLQKWQGGLRHTLVQVSLPKFKVSSSFGLGDVLKALGMGEAFDPDKADFSGIAKAEKLFISAVLHKAYVAVDEEGTEAAAATAVVVAATAMPVEPPQPKVFRADHPFLFLIRHNESGAILFLGRLAVPPDLEGKSQTPRPKSQTNPNVETPS